MTDAECVDAMNRGLEVEAVGSVLVPPGARFRLVGYEFGFAGGRIWKKSHGDLFGFFARELTLAPPAPAQAPPAFQVGDRVIYIGHNPLAVPFGTRGTIERLHLTGCEVDFPAFPCPPGLCPPGFFWVIPHKELQHDPAFLPGTPPPPAPVAQAISVTLPIVASWTGDGTLTIHRSRSAAPPHYPHVCPTCKAPAYIGFSKIDCSAGCP